jgi:O-methyltransferase
MLTSRDRIGDLVVRSGRSLRLDAVARPLLRLAPSALQRRARRWLNRSQVRRGYRSPLVPETALERCFRQILAHLVKMEELGNLGDYFEFGVCHGTSMMCMHRALADLELDHVRLFGFDSFEGLPEAARTDDEGLWRPGQFEADLEMTRRLMTEKGADWDRTFLSKGWFSDTLNEALIRRHAIRRASVIMIDCDIYCSAREALAFCAPLIKRRAVIVLDDWNAFRGHLARNNLGEKRAFEEFLVANEHLSAEEMPTYHERAKVFMVTAGA